MRLRGPWVSAAIAATWVLAAAAAHPAPIRAVSPSTGIFLGNVLTGRATFVEASGAGAEVSTRTVPAAGFYSPTTNTLLGLVIPYVERRLRIPGVGEKTTRGLGDLALIGHYRFVNRLGRGYADMAAARVTLELPTGSTDRSFGATVAEPVRRALQPGSGSTDLVFTVAAGREHYRYNVDVDAGYRLNTEADGFRFGDQVFADLSLEAFVLPAWTRARGFEVLTAVEFQFSHVERSRFGGAAVPDSGGETVSVAPGLQWIATERLLLEVSVRLPLVQDLDGRQPTLDHDVLVGFRLAF